MSNSISDTAWVYAIVKNPGAREQLVGFTDNEGIRYIPIIKSKEDAEDFLSYTEREPGQKYEVQAIIYEDIKEYALNNNFIIFLVDKKGAVKEKIDPEK